MVDVSNDHLYTWTLEHDAMKAAGCCLTLFDPAKGAPEVEFEMTRSEIEPMDVTVGDEQVRFEGVRILALLECVELFRPLGVPEQVGIRITRPELGQPILQRLRSCSL